MSPMSAMSMTRVPERAGNWLFHCHFQIHVVPHAPLDAGAARTTGAQRAAARRAARAVDAATGHTENHSFTGMGGLVMGIIVTPRAGRFMYHSHVDEPRQQRAGLVGALIVRERGTSTTDDYAFFIKSALAGANAVPIRDINAQSNPDTVVFGVGRPARLRFMSLALLNPNATVTLTARRDSSLRNLRETLIVQWRPVAKDGADVPEHARAPRLARQTIGMGETYDFELVPTTAGVMQVEVRGFSRRAAGLGYRAPTGACGFFESTNA